MLDFLPTIGSLDKTQSLWVWGYVGMGLLSWAYIQWYYVTPGRNYWQGFGAGDPMSTSAQLSTGLQQVVLWPIALMKTTSMTGTVPAPS